MIKQLKNLLRPVWKKSLYNFTNAICVFGQSLCVLQERLFKLSDRELFSCLGLRIKKVLYNKGFINSKELVINHGQVLIFYFFQYLKLLRLLIL